MNIGLHNWAYKKAFGICLDDAMDFLYFGLLEDGHIVHRFESALDETLDFHIIVGYHFDQDRLSKWPYPKHRTAIIQLENLISSSFASSFNAELFEGFNVWDYSVQNLNRYRTIKCNAMAFQWGYTKHLKTIHNNDSTNLDVLFYGSMNPRRESVISQYEAVCSYQTLFNVFGNSLDDKLRQAKIVISPHYYPEVQTNNGLKGHIPASLRLAYCLNNGVPVQLERSSLSEENFYWRQYALVSDYDTFVADTVIALDLEYPAMRHCVQKWQKETSMAKEVHSLIELSLSWIENFENVTSTANQIRSKDS